MKIKAIVAAGAIGLGMGAAGLMTEGTASAQTCADDTPPLTPTRVVCVTNEQVGEFLRTTSPQYNIDVLLNGQNETAGDPSTNNGLGLLDQPQTFVNSIVGPGGFLDGPRSPDPAPESGSGF
jgi:hypothetical protein